MKNDPVCYEVKQSYDYDKFILPEWNRDVKEGHIVKICRSLKAVGQRRAPIIVNEKMEIVDGQTRYMAFRKMGLPVQYVIDEGANEEVCVKLNTGQANWGTQDYIDAYAKQGMRDYALFKMTLSKYPALNWQALYGIITNNIESGGAAAKKIKSGEMVYTAARAAEIEPSLKFIESNSEDIRKFRGEKRIIITAVGWILCNTAADRKRLEQILKERYPEFKPVTSVMVFLGDIEEEYNRKLQAKNRIYFTTDYKKSKLKD